MSEDKKKDIVIHNADELANVLKDRKANASKRIMNDSVMQEETPRFEHTKCANQAIKVIQYLPVDEIIKVIMTRRLVAPLVTGKEVTHMQLALEFGLRSHEVKEMEEFGLTVLADYMTKHDTQDAVNKFNRDNKIDQAIQKIKNEAK